MLPWIGLSMVISVSAFALALKWTKIGASSEEGIPVFLVLMNRYNTRKSISNSINYLP